MTWWSRLSAISSGRPARSDALKAWDEMICIGPDHPYYSLLAELVSAVGKSWQQRYDHGRRGSPDTNPYSWAGPEG